MIYAVIDTNVLVSALLTSHADSATVMVMNTFYRHNTGGVTAMSLRCFIPD